MLEIVQFPPLNFILRDDEAGVMRYLSLDETLEVLGNSDRSRSVVISSRLPIKLIKVLDRLVERGDYINRSEIIRVAVNKLLKELETGLDPREKKVDYELINGRTQLTSFRLSRKYIRAISKIMDGPLAFNSRTDFIKTALALYLTENHAEMVEKLFEQYIRL